MHRSESFFLCAVDTRCFFSSPSSSPDTHTHAKKMCCNWWMSWCVLACKLFASLMIFASLSKRTNSPRVSFLVALVTCVLLLYWPYYRAKVKSRSRQRAAAMRAAADVYAQ